MTYCATCTVHVQLILLVCGFRSCIIIMYVITYLLILAPFFPEPMLTCKRKPDVCVKEKVVVVPQLPIDTYKKKYEENKKKWAQTTPSLVSQQQTKKESSQTCIKCGSVALDHIQPIIHGHNAPEKHFPWHVYIRGNKVYCGGTLISSQWVLTAAHCIKNTAYIVMGTHDLSKYDKERQKRLALKEIIHENFTSVNDDIALIKMDQPVVFTDYIRPACLPKQDADLPYQHECYLTGFGQTDYNNKTGSNYLLQVKLDIMNHLECVLKWYVGKKNVGSGHLCTKMQWAYPNIGGCSGDSGGPLSCLVDKTFYVTGVASVVQGKCRKTVLPDLYTRVSHYRRWIEQNVLENS